MNVFQRPVRDLTLRKLIALEADTPVREAIECMKKEDIGCVVIVDQDGRPVSTFSERSLVRLLGQSSEAYHEILNGTVGEQRDSVWAQVCMTDSILRVLDEMAKKGVYFVCVCDVEGRAVALTGQKGLVEYVAEHFPEQVQVSVRKVGVDHYPGNREGA